MEIDSGEGTGRRGHTLSLDQRLDEPIDDLEARRVRAMDGKKEITTLLVLRLAFQSLGVVYGDLSTSPLYVFNSTFPTGVNNPEDVMGALSLIIYSLTLIPLVKYVFVVMRANDNGEGGTFALYSLLCRHANVKTIPNKHRTDEELTTYSIQKIKDKSFAARTKKWLEAKLYRRNALLLLVLVGTSMVVGDGIFTPAISVLSSVGGIKVADPKLSDDVVVVLAVVILVALFSLQHYGTDKVGWLFAPVVLLWLLSIGSIGAYNIFKHDRQVLKAFSPIYIVRYFRRGKKQSWVSLGGIMLSITGTEALFADLGHFSTLAVQIAFTLVVFPCLLLQYMGQAAYIIHHQDHVKNAFYKSIPESIYWPVFIIATLAAIIASQATISATFTIIKQAVALGCFPRVKVVHTSKDISGQIYIPEINWILMALCIVVIIAGFDNPTQIGNAYGTAVISVMLVTTLMMALIMLIVWRTNWLLVFIFSGFFLFVELVYFSSVIFKVNRGGWAPVAVATILLIIMYVWHYVTVKRYEFETESKVSIAWVLGLGSSLGLVRVPGVGLVYTELATGVPHILSHFVTHLPALHSVVVFVCIKYLPVNTVPKEERFLVKRIGPKDFHMFRCVARYGYKDQHKKDDDFEKMLLDALSQYIRNESLMDNFSDSEDYSIYEQKPQDPQNASAHLMENGNPLSLGMVSVDSSHDSVISKISSQQQQSCDSDRCGASQPPTYKDELQFLNECRDAGVVHILGNTVIRARKESGIIKKVAVDYIYAFLRKICRGNSVIFNIPHESLLNVGQVLYV
uniref:Potassium transporter n=1 Tax=Araucaria cunninghamii TaxID=56994 RepID=A0A0D6QVT4_ARACU